MRIALEISVKMIDEPPPPVTPKPERKLEERLRINFESVGINFESVELSCRYARAAQGSSS